MEELPKITAESLSEGESVELTAEGMGSLLVTRGYDDDGKPCWIIYDDDATAGVELKR